MISTKCDSKGLKVIITSPAFIYLTLFHFSTAVFPVRTLLHNKSYYLPVVTLRTESLLLCSPGEEFSLLQNLTAAFQDDDAHCVVRFANSLFLQQGVTFNPEFLHLMRKYFKAEVETVDFSESAAVAEQINSWVENHTESE